jgi:hypothetical protein
MSDATDAVGVATVSGVRVFDASDHADEMSGSTMVLGLVLAPNPRRQPEGHDEAS